MVLLIVANRAGVWARADRTPFGHGRPFSKGQILRLLEDTAFEVTAVLCEACARAMSASCALADLVCLVVVANGVLNLLELLHYCFLLRPLDLAAVVVLDLLRFLQLPRPCLD